MTENKHIALVKKWLADPESVSQEERKSNSVHAIHCAIESGNEAAVAVAISIYAASSAENSADFALYWIKEYEMTQKEIEDDN